MNTCPCGAVARLGPFCIACAPSWRKPRPNLPPPFPAPAPVMPALRSKSVKGFVQRGVVRIAVL